MRSFVDTNVLLYLFDQDSPERKAAVQRIFRIEGSAGNLIFSTQVLQEFYVTVTRKLAPPLKPARALEAVTTLLKFPIVEVSPSLIVAAARRSQTDSMSFWDSLIIEAALKSGSQRLWSEDLQHGRTLEGMRIENSFLQA